MGQDHLSRFEDSIQRLIEGGFSRLFAGRLHSQDVAVQLARAMEDKSLPGQDSKLIAPDIYTVRLHRRDHQAILNERPKLPDMLAEELVKLARAAGLVFLSLPEIRLIVDDTISAHHVKINARHSTTHRDTTESLDLSGILEDNDNPIPIPNAVLLMDEQYIPLSQPLINIGRHRDNHIIIDDVRVSRHHAQFRVRFGEFVLFDLGSSGGTRLNGKTIQISPLKSGDVISLSGYPMIYKVQANHEDEQTRPHDSSSVS